MPVHGRIKVAHDVKTVPCVCEHMAKLQIATKTNIGLLGYLLKELLTPTIEACIGDLHEGTGCPPAYKTKAVFNNSK